MNPRIFLLLFLFIPLCTVKAQLSSSEKEILSLQLEQRINRLRQEVGEKPLERDINLAKAAQLQSDYNVEKKVLTHEQSSDKFRTVRNRVDHFIDYFGTVGENVLYTKPVRGNFNQRVLEKLAFDMYQSWKNSPGHYANMISAEFTFGDFGFTYDTKSRRVYATQVFGRKGEKIPGQLSENAFGIIDGGNTCLNLLSGQENLLTNMGNSLYIENNKIYLKHHSIQTLRTLIANKLDGIAVDLVTHTQLPCGTDNKLDLSSIHDGIMLPPIFRDQLFDSNIAKGDFRLIAELGTIPSDLVGKDLSANLILIKDNMKCGYSTSTSIPHATYKLRKIEPVLYQPNVKLITEGIRAVHEIAFNFDLGKTTPSNSPTIPYIPKKLYLVEVKSYTSVDGSEKGNSILHTKRGSYISEFVKRKFPIEDVPIQITAKENWELCDYQLELKGLELLRKKEKESIRNHISKNKDKYWEKALNEQRKSKAILYELGTWYENDYDHAYNNLVHGLISSDSDLANQAIIVAYHDSFFFDLLKNDYFMERLLVDADLVQNFSALLLKNLPFHSLDHVIYYIRNWLSKPEQLTEGAQKNLLNLYTITSERMLRSWDTSSEDLSKVLHPEKVEPLFNNYKSSDVVNPLFLNFHMSSIYYYGQINYNPKINESFYFITSYFKTKALTTEDDIALGLFFNSWSMYHSTIDLLLPLTKNPNSRMNEKALFILAQTATAYPYKTSEKKLSSLHLKAIRTNKQKWCEWITKDFQNLRNSDIKELYCKHCKQKHQ